MSVPQLNMASVVKHYKNFNMKEKCGIYSSKNFLIPEIKFSKQTGKLLFMKLDAKS